MDIFGRGLVGIGILSLLHAGYSTVQYRTYLKLIEEDFSQVPVDVSNYCSSLLKEVIFAGRCKGGGKRESKGVRKSLFFVVINVVINELRHESRFRVI